MSKKAWNLLVIKKTNFSFVISIKTLKTFFDLKIVFLVENS